MVGIYHSLATTSGMFPVWGYSSYSFLFISVGTFNIKSTLITKFYVYNTVLLTRGTMYRTLELNHLA